MRPMEFVVFACLLLVPGLSADEDLGHEASQVADRALEALKLRMEARIQEGALLSRTGRVEEALEADRSVGRLCHEGMQAVRDLVARLGPGLAGGAPGP